MTETSSVRRRATASRFRAVLVAAALAVALLGGGAFGVSGTSVGTANAAPPVVAKDFSKPAIVILGYGLKPDGTMRLILHTRVLAGLAVAQLFPQAPIIVTGGNPRNGNTEAEQMGKMLRLYGTPRERIILEERASSTVQNAAFSVPLAKKAGTSGIILVTSSSHQDRADGNFADAGGNVLATVSFPDQNPSINIAQFVRDVLSPFVAIS
ncbi:YdcF family protein [Mycolicibacterium sp. CR10]|uniref:YdcF family protein n=1 Tax=Mycolicibacterium sp. CR10 TaxID=2562314 RepID=UPI0010BF9372|nr:YdcF family protein [Mycolicibacterium sp. CR10]